MRRKTKGRADWHQADPKTICTLNSTGIVYRLKAVIVTWPSNIGCQWDRGGRLNHNGRTR